MPIRIRITIMRQTAILLPAGRPPRPVREQRVLGRRDALHGDDRAALLGGAPRRRPRRRLGRLQQRRAQEPLPLHGLRIQVCIWQDSGEF